MQPLAVQWRSRATRARRCAGVISPVRDWRLLICPMGFEHRRVGWVPSPRRALVEVLEALDGVGDDETCLEELEQGGAGVSAGPS